MTTMYRVQYKVVEPTKYQAGVRVVDKPLDQYIEVLRKAHPDATVIHLELLEEFEYEEPGSQTARESLIILGFEGGWI